MLSINKVTKIYKKNIVALKDVSFEVENREFCYITGHSGAGKSTLIRLILREEVPTYGSIIFNTVNITELPIDYIGAYRQQIGIVFQDYKLIPTKTVFENISFVLEVLDKPNKEIKKSTLEILDRVGLKGKEDLYPNQLSGGEQQRVAIARAIINQPVLLIADEPTGNLDNETAIKIIDLLKDIYDTGTDVIVSTHNFDLIKRVNGKVIELKDGHIVQ